MNKRKLTNQNIETFLSLLSNGSDETFSQFNSIKNV